MKKLKSKTKGTVTLENREFNVKQDSDIVVRRLEKLYVRKALLEKKLENVEMEIQSLEKLS